VRLSKFAKGGKRKGECLQVNRIISTLRSMSEVDLGWETHDEPLFLRILNPEIIQILEFTILSRLVTRTAFPTYSLV
jgi:hypothetical protein